MRHGIALGLGLAAAALTASPAFAPAGAAASSCNGNRPSALKGHNSNAPVDWSTDHSEIDDRAGRAVLTGNVVATQGDLVLNAPRVIATYTHNPGIHVERLDASGGVVVHSPSETARGAFGIYDLDRKIITMIGNVSLTRCDGTVRGARLTYDLNSGRAVMDGSGAGGASGKGGRVSGTFTVPQNAKPAATPAPGH
jgi:lipopolysaccharide export system protein LptA